VNAMGRRKSSDVWEFFTEYEVDDRKVWECVLCKDETIREILLISEVNLRKKRVKMVKLILMT
jgi:hypothetical protein